MLQEVASQQGDAWRCRLVPTAAVWSTQSFFSFLKPSKSFSVRSAPPTYLITPPQRSVFVAAAVRSLPLRQVASRSVSQRCWRESGRTTTSAWRSDFSSDGNPVLPPGVRARSRASRRPSAAKCAIFRETRAFFITQRRSGTAPSDRLLPECRRRRDRGASRRRCGGSGGSR